MRPTGSVVALTGLLPAAAGAQSWAAQFPPAADCRLAFAAAPRLDPALAARGVGTIAVRVRRFGTPEPVRQAQIQVAPLDGAPGDTTARPAGPAYDLDTASVRTFGPFPAGRYAVTVRAIGYAPRIDTIAVRAGAADTASPGLEAHLDGFRNAHNFRPRGFRRPGERACADVGDGADRLLEYARDFAVPERRRQFPQVPRFAAAAVALVRDEAVCERAGRAYGGTGSPPRRVLVVRLGAAGYVVYDPYEPLDAGEWDVTTIFDRRWRVIVSLAG